MMRLAGRGHRIWNHIACFRNLASLSLDRFKKGRHFLYSLYFSVSLFESGYDKITLSIRCEDKGDNAFRLLDKEPTI